MSQLVGRLPPAARFFASVACACGLAPLVLVLFLLSEARGQSAGDAPEYWVLSTQDCAQVLGSDAPLPLRAHRMEMGGLTPRDPAELLARVAGRPVIFLLHGSYIPAGRATVEGQQIRNDLASQGAIPPNAVVIEFEWPSLLVRANFVRDANEKTMLAFATGYHLARLLQSFPPGSRVSLIGHSHGGLAVLSALHLLGGGTLHVGGIAARLPANGPHLRLRAVVMAPACDRQWRQPGERLDRAITASEGILCLYNPLDPVLVIHPFGRYSDHRRALGKMGMSRAGPTDGRYVERGIGLKIGVRHTFRGTTANPVIARWFAPYTWTGE